MCEAKEGDEFEDPNNGAGAGRVGPGDEDVTVPRDLKEPKESDAKMG